MAAEPTAAPPVGLDVQRVHLRLAASKLYRELRWTGLDHVDARDQVERIVMEACRG